MTCDDTRPRIETLVALDSRTRSKKAIINTEFNTNIRTPQPKSTTI